jgi:transposase
VVCLGRAVPPAARYQGGKDAQAHLPNLLSYFRHRITNATSEGFNSVTQALKYAARGFRSFQNDRTRILFFCGKLDLRPRLPCH